MPAFCSRQRRSTEGRIKSEASEQPAKRGGRIGAKVLVEDGVHALEGK